MEESEQSEAPPEESGESSESGGDGSPHDLDAERRAYERRMDQVVPPPEGSETEGAGGESRAAAPNETNQVPMRTRGPVCVRDYNGEPVRLKPYTIVINDEGTEGHTDEEGWIEAVDPSVTEAVLYVGDAGYTLKFGEEPSDPTTLAQSMLNALGYSAGPLDGEAGDRTKAATAYYQRDNGLEINGELNEDTVGRMKEQHRLA
jgi:hypothetical protein